MVSATIISSAPQWRPINGQGHPRKCRKTFVALLCFAASSSGLVCLSLGLAISQFYKFRMDVETRRNRARIVRNRCVPVCGHCAGYFGLGLASPWPDSGSKSKISDRILKMVRGPFSSAEVDRAP